MPEMLKRIMDVVTALLLVGAPMAQGNPGSGDAHGTGRLTPIEFKILTDARVGMVKVALQLTPEQQQYWPAAGDAILARSEACYHRLSAFGEPLNQRLIPGQKIRLRLVTVRAIEGLASAVGSRQMDMFVDEDYDFDP
jgi:hypothetical protein